MPETPALTREEREAINRIGEKIGARPDSIPKFEGLGKSGVSTLGGKLETFPNPGVSNVEMICDEVTGLCPVTGQPDQYVVEISYDPDQSCIESKSMKLYLQGFRNRGIFGEALSAEIADVIATQIKPIQLRVDVTQKSRGGISIVSSTYRSRP